MAGEGSERKILFATSNGTGLGHLNRAMAIARRLPEEIEPVFFTLSQAAPVVAEAGFRVEYHAAYRRPASGSDWQWNLRLRHRLERLLDDERPDLLLFDGVHPYRALTHVLSERGRRVRSVWCRRPMWRPDTDASPLGRAIAFDSVLEPGELAAEADHGPTVGHRDEVVAVDPIVYLDRDELLDRDGAARELGLDPGRTTALVNLGQGGAVDATVARVLRRLGEEGDGLQVAALQSSIGEGLEVPDEVVRLEATFPMSRYFAAFDLAVAAAGYNAFHELIAFGVPALFVPMPRQTDDQAARALWALDAGLARAVEGPGAANLEDELSELLEADQRERLREGCAAAFERNGAVEAAEELSRLAHGKRPRHTVREHGPLKRWLRLSSHPVGPSLPLALGLTARDLIRHPERRRPKAVVYALGRPEHDFEAELTEAVDSFGVPRGRVMVVTDSLDLATLRGLGVAFHRIPSASELGLDFDDPAYRRLLDDRLELALSPWRGSWPLKRIGSGGEALRLEAGGAAEDAVAVRGGSDDPGSDG